MEKRIHKIHWWFWIPKLLNSSDINNLKKTDAVYNVLSNYKIKWKMFFSRGQYLKHTDHLYQMVRTHTKWSIFWPHRKEIFFAILGVCRNWTRVFCQQFGNKNLLSAKVIKDFLIFAWSSENFLKIRPSEFQSLHMLRPDYFFCGRECEPSITCNQILNLENFNTMQ